VGDAAVLGGAVAVCPFCAVGSYAFLAGGSMVEGDVPDGLRGKGDRATLQGVNFEGLRRNGYSAEAVSLTQRACRELFRGGADAGGAALAERAAAMLATGGCPAASICPIYPTDGKAQPNHTAAYMSKCVLMQTTRCVRTSHR